MSVEAPSVLDGSVLHVLLVHQCEVVLELETELQPGPLIVVIRSRSLRPAEVVRTK